jgi:hypothetical protein
MRRIETGVYDLTVYVCTGSLSKVVQLHDGRLIVTDRNKVPYIIAEARIVIKIILY